MLAVAGWIDTTTGWWTPLPQPRAHTLLYIAAAPPVFLDNPRPPGDALAQNQLYLVRSGVVLRAALRQPEVAKLGMVQAQADPVGWLRKRIAVDSPSPGFLHIIVHGEEPDGLIVLANAVSRAYLDEVAGKDRDKRLEQLKRLKDRKAAFEQRVERQRKQLRTSDMEVSSSNGENQTIQEQIMLEDLRNTLKQLAQIRLDLRKLQVSLGLIGRRGGSAWQGYAAALSFSSTAGSPVNLAVVGVLHEMPFVLYSTPYGAIPNPFLPDPATVATYLDRDPTVLDYLRQANELKGQMERLRQTSASQATFQERRTKIRADLAKIEEAIKKRREELRPLVTEEARKQAEQQAQTTRLNLIQQYVQLQEMERALGADANRLAEQTKQPPKATADVARLREDIAKADAALARADYQIEALEAEQEAAPRATLVEEASLEVPEDDGQLKRMNRVVVALGGLGVLLLIFAGLEFLISKPRH
jgi:hypothetical protein